MDPQQLLTTPASALTRKQRKDRAALKAEIASQARYLLPGYLLGRSRVVEPLPDGSAPAPRPGHVIVQLGEQALGPFAQR